MEYLKIILYILVFPGIIFSSLIGFFISGLDRKIVAKMQRRRGPKISQSFYDFIKLLGKDTIIPSSANRKLFIIAPVIAMVSIVIIPLFIPLGKYTFIKSTADVVVLIYLLIIPSLALIIGAMASASPFASIGLSREVVSIIGYELPLIIIIIDVCKKAGKILGTGTIYSMELIEKAQAIEGNFMFSLALLPAAIAFLMILPAKVGVAPFDVAEAETEICEGPLVEYSGIYLSLFKLSHSIKSYVMAMLFVALFLGNIFVEFGSTSINLIINTVIMIALSTLITIVCLSIVRGSMGRYKAHQMFKFYWTIPTILSVISYFLVSMNI